MSCTNLINSHFTDQSSLDSWKNSTLTILNQYTTKPMYTADDLNYVVNNIAVDVDNHYQCIKSKGLENSLVGNNVNSLQDRLANLTDTIEQREKDVMISHDRALIARNPEQSRGYYDGWFPISRPLKHYTIPILISISIFLFTLALLYFLSLLGLDIRFIVQIPVMRQAGTTFSYGAPHIFKSKPFLIMSGVALILLILTIYGFSKK